MVTKQICELIHSCVIQIFRVHFVYHSWFCLSIEWVHLIIPFLMRQVAVVHEIESEVGFALFAQFSLAVDLVTLSGSKNSSSV